MIQKTFIKLDFLHVVEPKFTPILQCVIYRTSLAMRTTMRLFNLISLQYSFHFIYVTGFKSRARESIIRSVGLSVRPSVAVCEEHATWSTRSGDRPCF